jgi:hypothetical protein
MEYKIMDKPDDRPPADQEPEEKEKKKCMQCRQRHSGPTPLCPHGPY